MRSLLLLAIALFLSVSGAIAAERGASAATFEITPDEFIQKFTRVHAVNPYRRITFDFSGTAHAEGQLFIFRLSDDCGISGKGSFSLDADGKLVMKAENVSISCQRVLRLVEETIGNRIKDYFTIPDLEKLAQDDGLEFIALSPDDAALYADLGAIAPAKPGHAVLLGANRALIEYMRTIIPGRTREDAILVLQNRTAYLRWFEMRRTNTKQYTQGALSVRVDMEWDTGAFRSMVLGYPWGEPKVVVDQMEFTGRLVWRTVRIEANDETHRAVITAPITLSNFAIEP